MACIYLFVFIFIHLFYKMYFERRKENEKNNNNTVLCISSKLTLSGRPLSIARRRTLQLASREIYDVKS